MLTHRVSCNFDAVTINYFTYSQKVDCITTSNGNNPCCMHNPRSGNQKTSFVIPGSEAAVYSLHAESDSYLKVALRVLCCRPKSWLATLCAVIFPAVSGGNKALITVTLALFCSALPRVFHDLQMCCGNGWHNDVSTKAAPLQQKHFHFQGKRNVENKKWNSEDWVTRTKTALGY